jgi:hypothetical protein
MPISLPAKSRAKTAPVTQEIDWLGLWAISLGAAAIVLAPILYFAADENTGAFLIFLSAAGMIAAGAARRRATRPTPIRLRRCPISPVSSRTRSAACHLVAGRP